MSNVACTAQSTIEVLINFPKCSSYREQYKYLPEIVGEYVAAALEYVHRHIVHISPLIRGLSDTEFHSCKRYIRTRLYDHIGAFKRWQPKRETRITNTLNLITNLTKTTDMLFGISGPLDELIISSQFREIEALVNFTDGFKVDSFTFYDNAVLLVISNYSRGDCGCPNCN